jgi:dCMP deaminase
MHSPFELPFDTLCHEDKQYRFDMHYMRLAHLVGFDLSKDPSTKVGALILGADQRSVSVGYNGFPAGTFESPDLWQDRSEKYPRVIHAEINALLNCPFSTIGATIYCSLFPCHHCLGCIINAGITRIVYYGERWEREPHPHIVNELMNNIAVHQFEDIDPFCELIRTTMGALSK